MSSDTRPVMENRYPLVLYLNQKYVFDFLAMMEGGLSGFESIRTRQSESAETSGSVSGEIGVKQVFGLFGMKLGGDAAGKKGATAETETTKERVYTPNALFARFRENLFSERLVRSSSADVKPGEFIEFKTVLRKNPIIEILQFLLSASSLMSAFPSSEPSARGKESGQKNKENSPGIARQVQKLLEDLTRSGYVDLIGGGGEPPDTKFLLTVDKAFLAEPTMSDLVDGSFFVLGKIQRVLTSASSGDISLLRNSTLGRVGEGSLNELLGKFAELRASGTIVLPEFETSIKFPAVHVIPVAIFA